MDTHNFHKQDMASVDWLAKHFFAKSHDRFNQLSRLPIYPGDKLLDLCCGPGFYLNYFSHLVGPSGHVTGVDHDPISLDFAERYLLGFPFKNWDLVHSGLTEFLEKINGYDVVLIFNAIGYFEDPISILEKIREKMKPGARLIIKDFDLESIFLSPIDELKFAELIIHAKKNDIQSNPLKFTNFFGRKVHFLSSKIEHVKVKNEIWTQAMGYPFDQYQIEYIWKNFEALILQAETSCSKETIAYFKDMFCSEDKPFFAFNESIFLENEYVTTIIV